MTSHSSPDSRPASAELASEEARQRIEALEHDLQELKGLVADLYYTRCNEAQQRLWTWITRSRAPDDSQSAPAQPKTE